MDPKAIREKEDENIRIFLHLVHADVFILVVFDRTAYTYIGVDTIHYLRYIDLFLLEKIINNGGFYLNRTWKGVKEVPAPTPVVSVKGHHLVITE